ncbi:MAG: type II toxin-antitoxin system VapC family toxin [Thermoanaerobaculia bacterium]
MIVLDASAALELLLRTAVGRDLAERVFDPAESLHAPELIDLEVGQVLRRYERTGVLGAARAEEALADFAALPLERYSHRLVLARAWQLRANLTLSDAAYVALAELLDAPLVTCDAALARAPHAARVEVLGGG